MAPFPDNLPPEGLDAIYKLLIYYGLVFVFLTAITSWLITRRRSFPKQKIVERATPSVQAAMNVTDTLNFDNTADRLASLIIEEYGHESAIGKLNDLKDQLGDRAYDKINIHYNDRLADIKMEIDSIEESMMQEEEASATPVSEEEQTSIDEDLEAQLLNLDADDTFLKPRKKKNMDEIFESEAPAPVTTSTPVTPPTSTPVSTPTSPPPQMKATPIPPAPAKKVAPIPPPPIKSENKTSAMPPAPAKKAAPPPPPGKSAGVPQATEPTASVPTASEPLSAAQPMKVQSDQDDAMFAKSTSIAALRMDMLRELARLKKLIPEDQEKD